MLTREQILTEIDDATEPAVMSKQEAVDYLERLITGLEQRNQRCL